MRKNKVIIRYLKLHNFVLECKEKINLSNMKRCVEQIKSICEALNLNKTAEILLLRKNGIDSEGAKYLSISLGLNKSLTQIDLSFNTFHSEGFEDLSKAISRNKKLLDIDLTRINNNLDTKYINLFLGNLQKNKFLTKINLSKNRLNHLSAKLLSNLLVSNKSLTHLNLKNNNLRKLGAFHISEALERNDTLTYLNLSKNIIKDRGATSVSKIFQKNKSLCVLDLSENYITDEGARFLFSSLEKNDSATKLNLQKNKISKSFFELMSDQFANEDLLKQLVETGKFDAAELLVKLKYSHRLGKKIKISPKNFLKSSLLLFSESLKKSNLLQKLDLSKMLFKSNECIQAISESLLFNTTLTKLDLSNKYFNMESTLSIAHSLNINSTLKTLKLIGSLKDEVMETFFSQLNNSSLTYLDVSSSIFHEKINSVLEYFSKNTNLNTLKLSGCLINTKLFPSVIDSFNNPKNSLTSLDLSENFFNNVSFISLTNLIDKTVCLRELFLKGILIEHQNWVSLCESLKSNKTIKVLDISKNNIDDEQLIQIINLFKFNNTISSLNLSSNKLKEPGILMLSDFLKKDPTFFKELDISSNYIKDSASNLIDSLIINTSLNTLSLSDCFSINNIDLLSKLIQFNNSITSLDLSNNNIDNKSFFQSLEKNSSIVSLKLSNCNLQTHNYFENLKNNQTLTSLDLSRNYLNLNALKYISEIKSLKELNIEKIPIETRHIVSILSTNHSLIKIHGVDKTVWPLLFANTEWKPSKHIFHSFSFQYSVFSFLLSLKVLQKNLDFKIPKFVLFEIIKKIDKKAYLLPK